MKSVKTMGCVLTLALMGLGLVACSDLRDIPPDVCGNLVLDKAEDCDGSSPFGEVGSCGEPGTANACFLVCDSEVEMSCPDGWGCGTDGRCRRPSGQFTQGPGSPWRFPVDSFGVGDVDGDGFADLIGNSASTITVRYGDDIGSFAAELDVFTREPTGPLTFADINGDKRVDVMVPIEAGLFTLLGTSGRELDPVAYSPFVTGTEPVRILPVPSDEVVNVGAPLAILGGGENNIFFLGPLDPPTLALPVGFSVDDLAGRIPVAHVDHPVPLPSDNASASVQGGRHSFALAFVGASKVRIISSTGGLDIVSDDLAPVLTHTIDLPLNATVAEGGAQFADIDGDGTTDLLVHVNRPSFGKGLAVSYDMGTGASETLALTATMFNLRVPTLVQPLPFPLAMGDLSGDGKADYVTSGGIYVSSIGELVFDLAQVLNVGSLAEGGPWVSSTIGDFNGDGHKDVASASEETDAVFIYLGTGTGLFNRFVVATDLPPTSLRTGDFDGDLVEDVAFIERDSENLKADRLSVIFGSQTGTMSAPVFMGEFGDIEMVEPALIALSSHLDLVSDLLVISASGEGVVTRSVALLEGSSTRRMVSPFALQQNGISDVPLRAVAGSFTEDGAIGDVVVVARPAGTKSDKAARLYLLKGSGNGQFDASASSALDLDEGLGFAAGCAHWAVGDLDHKSGDDSPGTDELIGFDSALGCRSEAGFTLPKLAVAEANPDDGELPLSVDLVSIDDDDLRVLTDLNLFDADLDGDLDLVVLYRGTLNPALGGGDGPEGDGVVVYWHQDGELVSSSALDGADKGVLAVAPMLISGNDAIPELVVLARDALYVSEFDRTTGLFGELTHLRASSGYEDFEVGDLNGDGLVDIALRFGDKVEVLLAEPAKPLGEEQELAELLGQDSEPGQ